MILSTKFFQTISLTLGSKAYEEFKDHVTSNINVITFSNCTFSEIVPALFTKDLRNIGLYDVTLDNWSSNIFHNVNPNGYIYLENWYVD